MVGCVVVCVGSHGACVCVVTCECVHVAEGVGSVCFVLFGVPLWERDERVNEEALVGLFT